MWRDQLPTWIQDWTVKQTQEGLKAWRDSPCSQHLGLVSQASRKWNGQTIECNLIILYIYILYILYYIILYYIIVYYIILYIICDEAEFHIHISHDDGRGIPNETDEFESKGTDSTRPRGQQLLTFNIFLTLGCGDHPSRSALNTMVVKWMGCQGNTRKNKTMKFQFMNHHDPLIVCIAQHDYRTRLQTSS